MKLIENKIFANESDDGLQFLGPSSSDVIVRNCEFFNCGDELASVVKGATNIIFEDCKFYDNDKGILVGTGDEEDYELEKDVTVSFRRCTFDGIARRHPFFRYGVLSMQDCIIRNWKGGYKTYGIKLESGAVAYLRDIHFHQDKFRFEPLNWLRGGGCWKAFKTDGTCNIHKSRITKNKWWIVL